MENDIDSRPFSSQVLACLPPLPWSLSSEDLANPCRLDLRHVRVFSVDPPGKYLLFLNPFFVGKDVVNKPNIFFFPTSLGLEFGTSYKLSHSFYHLS